MGLHEKHGEWLEARGIPVALATEYGIHTHQDERGLWLRVPFLEHGQPVNHKWRQTRTKRFAMDAGQPLSLWNHQALVEAVETGRPLTIFEGEMDALTAISLGHRLSVSVPNGAPQRSTESPWGEARYEWAVRDQKLLDRVAKFTLATDGDDAGFALAADLARLFGPERCSFVSYPDGCKDLNEVLLRDGPEATEQVLATAKEYPVLGLRRISDFPPLPDFKPINIGIPGLKHLFPLVTGTFTVLTGWAGHGKSSLLFVILANLIKAGVPLALGSFETMPKPILVRALRAAYYGCSEQSPMANQPGPADEMIEHYLRIISNFGVTDDTELTIEYILELARIAVLRDGVKLVVLDPWNEIEHKRGRDETETDYVGRAIRLIKRFARDYDCAVWLVAHPRKPQSDGNPKPPSLYDLAGSANFANKADYGVVVHRDDLATVGMDARVVKVRKGLPGFIGRVSLIWNDAGGRYDLGQ